MLFFSLYFTVELIITYPPVLFRWSCLVGWRTWATPVTWTPPCSVCVLCRSWKLPSEGGFSNCVYQEFIQEIVLLLFCNCSPAELVCLPLQVFRCSAILRGKCTITVYHSRYEPWWIVHRVKSHVNIYAFNLLMYLKYIFASSALRDLYETMEKTSSSLPPIILLQFLHMAFPQFAEKGDQGQYLQQVRNSNFCCCKTSNDLNLILNVMLILRMRTSAGCRWWECFNRSWSH